MNNKILILSDIHGNLEALKAVLDHENITEVSKMILLGDMIDYGPRSNEVIQMIKMLPQEKMLVNLWGNHERAVLTGDFGHFSSQRGVQSAKYTSSILDENSRKYLERIEKSGFREFTLGTKRCLAVHGSLEDAFWKSISPENLHGDYKAYRYIFSGHSHCPHCFQVFYEDENITYRNKKRVLFVNPGSVGQPRDHNPYASYALMDADTEEVRLKRTAYEIKKEQAYFPGQIDAFYKIRLERGV